MTPEPVPVLAAEALIWDSAGFAGKGVSTSRPVLFLHVFLGV